MSFIPVYVASTSTQDSRSPSFPPLFAALAHHCQTPEAFRKLAVTSRTSHSPSLFSRGSLHLALWEPCWPLRTLLPYSPLSQQLLSFSQLCPRAEGGGFSHLPPSSLSAAACIFGSQVTRWDLFCLLVLSSTSSRTCPQTWFHVTLSNSAPALILDDFSIFSDDPPKAGLSVSFFSSSAPALPPTLATHIQRHILVM